MSVPLMVLLVCAAPFVLGGLAWMGYWIVAAFQEPLLMMALVCWVLTISAIGAVGSIGYFALMGMGVVG